MGWRVLRSSHFVSDLNSVFSSHSNGRWNPFHFILASRITPSILLVLSLLIMWQRANHQHISCYTPPDGDLRAIDVNQYCFATGTYTVLSNKSSSKRSRNHFLYPGVGPRLPASGSRKGTEIKYHWYFQWMSFILLVNLVLFAIPECIWTHFRGNIITSYYSQIMEEDPFKNSDTMHGVPIKGPAIRFLRNMGCHPNISAYFLFSQVLGIVMVYVAFYLIDLLLTGQFYDLGWAWLEYIQSSDSKTAPENPLEKVFPKMSKCEYRNFGPSGNIVNHDLLCVLTLNVLHEKVFIFLWFWYRLLVAMQITCTLYYFVLLKYSEWFYHEILRSVEPAFLQNTQFWENTKKEQEKGLLAKFKEDERVSLSFDFRKSAKTFIRKLGYNDKFLLYSISVVTEAEVFTHFFEGLINQWHNKKR